MSSTTEPDVTGAKRDALGRAYRGGPSLNPGGRPKSNAALRQKCRDLTDELVERLRMLARAADSDTASVSTIKLLLAYGHGAPESRPIDDETPEALGAAVTPAAALAALTAEARGPNDTEN